MKRNCDTNGSDGASLSGGGGSAHSAGQSSSNRIITGVGNTQLNIITYCTESCRLGIKLSKIKKGREA